MIKEITVCVPRYAKKFIVSEPDYQLLSGSVIRAPKLSELGHLISGFSRTIQYTQRRQVIQVPKTHELLTIQYLCKLKTFNVPVESREQIERFLVEQFRASLIREVSILHLLHQDREYGWMVKLFLEKRGIITDEKENYDIRWETAKKIYRDHLFRTEQRNSKKNESFEARFVAA